MADKRVTENMLKNIKDYENRKPYTTPFALQPDRLEDDSENIKNQVRREKDKS